MRIILLNGINVENVIEAPTKEIGDTIASQCGCVAIIPEIQSVNIGDTCNPETGLFYDPRTLEPCRNMTDEEYVIWGLKE